MDSGWCFCQELRLRKSTPSRSYKTSGGLNFNNAHNGPKDGSMIKDWYHMTNNNTKHLIFISLVNVWSFLLSYFLPIESFCNYAFRTVTCQLWTQIHGTQLIVILIPRLLKDWMHLTNQWRSQVESDLQQVQFSQHQFLFWWIRILFHHGPASITCPWMLPPQF